MDSRPVRRLRVSSRLSETSGCSPRSRTGQLLNGMLPDRQLRHAMTIRRPAALRTLAGKLDVHSALVERDLALNVALASFDEIRFVAHERHLIVSDAASVDPVSAQPTPNGDGPPGRRPAVGESGMNSEARSSAPEGSAIRRRAFSLYIRWSASARSASYVVPSCGNTAAPALAASRSRLPVRTSSWMSPIRVLQLAALVFRHLARAVRQHDDEFVAGVADAQVVGPQAPLQRVRHLAQRVVADAVAVCVVDGLEAVDVHDDQRDFGLQPFCARQLARQVREHRAAVRAVRSADRSANLPASARRRWSCGSPGRPVRRCVRAGADGPRRSDSVRRDRAPDSR